MISADLDSFKAINDTHGHAAGDFVLQTVARWLDGHVRPGDTVARMGGDEFVLLLRDLSSLEEAGAILERLREAMTESFWSGRTEIAGLSASIGFACYPEDAAEPSRLVAMADAAMYEAKRLGRNSIHLHRHDIDPGTTPPAPRAANDAA